ncbi:MAG TPA: NADH-quinone oxidoreductase subunit M [Anaerolineaceae bacterium]|nr:NADH-quinone oxidoreductase subunit M [Anaerolineaceae bacterium]
MNWWTNPLVILIAFPLAGAALIALIGSRQTRLIRWLALAVTLIEFGLSLWLLARFNPADGNLQLMVDQPWVNLFGLPVRLFLGVDGLSLLMVLLTTLLTPIAILSTWTAVEDRVKGFMLFFLLLESAMLGVFLALDLVLFFLFWELTLIPMYFLIGIWGGARRIMAAIKFFLFTMAGSILMLVAILYMTNAAGTASLPELMRQRALFSGAALWLFLAFGIAFAIKVPMWPLHTWLPDAHVEAPTAGSVILAAVLLKMGAYGFLRFNLSLFPQTFVQLAPWIGGLAVVGILYGAAVAYAQKDLKKLVAYSSVSHLGFVMLGIAALNPQGLAGAVLQMVNHGVSTGALFLFVGMLYERRHTRDLADFGGLWKVMPILGTLTLIIMLSSVGLPGLNGFVGEFNILLGAFGSSALGSFWFAALAALGVVLAAAYLLKMFEQTFLGPIKHEENRALLDLNPREIITLLPLLVLMFWIGLYPAPFLNLLNPTVTQILSLVAVP